MGIGRGSTRQPSQVSEDNRRGVGDSEAMAKRGKKTGRKAVSHSGDLGTESRRRLFAYLYVDLRNATHAAEQAGYSKKTAASQGSRLLKDAKVRALVDRLLEQQRARIETKTGITIERIVTELTRILTADPSEAFDDSGMIKPLKEWNEDLRRAVSGMDVQERLDMTDPDNPLDVRITKIKFWNKTASSDQLLRHLGAFEKDHQQQAKSLADLITAASRRRDEGGE